MHGARVCVYGVCVWVGGEVSVVRGVCAMRHARGVFIQESGGGAAHFTHGERRRAQLWYIVRLNEREARMAPSASPELIVPSPGPLADLVEAFGVAFEPTATDEKLL